MTADNRDDVIRKIKQPSLFITNDLATFLFYLVSDGIEEVEFEPLQVWWYPQANFRRVNQLISPLATNMF